MNHLNINHKGQLRADTSSPRFLVNNFTQSGTVTGWTFGTYTLTNGVVELTGTGPNIQSVVFPVGANDIICVEFTFALPTPSTTTSGPGLYFGTTYGQAVYIHSFNMSTRIWTASTSTTTNPYFFNSYNSTAVLRQKNYILGTAVSLSNVPWGDTTNTSYPPRAIQLSGTQTTIRLRSSYNSNSSMVIDFCNPRVYNINQSGYYEADNITHAKLGNNWVNTFELIEY